MCEKSVGFVVSAAFAQRVDEGANQFVGHICLVRVSLYHCGALGGRLPELTHCFVEPKIERRVGWLDLHSTFKTRLRRTPATS